MTKHTPSTPHYGQWKPGSGTAGKLATALGAIALALAMWWLAAQLGLTPPTAPTTNPEGAPNTSLPSTPDVDQRPLDIVVKDRADLPAMKKLEQLRVRHDRGAGGYDRTSFGEPWADVDGNGCDTRNDVLKRDLKDIHYRKGSRCVINRGILHDPYVGVTIDFKRGPDTSPLVQIDHVVALGDAWRAGASEWSPAERQEFANDPNNLLAVEGQANQDKESSRADQWMPPREEYWCEYVTRQINVKYDWDLTITEREREAMIRALSTCPR